MTEDMCFNGLRWNGTCCSQKQFSVKTFWKSIVVCPVNMKKGVKVGLVFLIYSSKFSCASIEIYLYNNWFCVQDRF